MSTLTDHALDTQLSLIRWCEGNYAQRYLQNMIDLNHDEIGSPAVWSGETLRAAIYGVLATAETFAVTEEMGMFLEAAAGTLPAFPLQASDLPCPRGFVYLEKGIVIYDRKSKPIVLKGFSWAASGVTETNDRQHLNEIRSGAAAKDVEHTGVWISLWTDPDDPEDMNYEQFHEIPWSVRGPMVWVSDFPWMFGMSWYGLGEYIVNVDSDRPGSAPADVLLDQNTRTMRILAAFFRVVMEPWVSQDAVLPTRPARRRRERLSIQLPEETVRVITLRRSREGYVPPVSDQEREEPFYSHRFMVRGHWRNQWYPKEQRHAPRWIAPYIKGPDGTPLVVHDHVYEWSR